MLISHSLFVKYFINLQLLLNILPYPAAKEKNYVSK
jgi:hypothetical protein